MSKSTFKIAFIVSIGILISVAYSVFNTLNNLQDDNELVLHTERIKGELENIGGLSKDMTNEVNEAIILEKFPDTTLIEEIKSSLFIRLNILDSLISDNPEQQRNAAKFREHIESIASDMEGIIRFVTTTNVDNQFDSTMMLLQERSVMSDSIAIVERKMQSAETKLLIERLKEKKNSSLWAPINLLLLTVIALCIISFLFINIFSLYKKNERSTIILKKNVDELDKKVLETDRLEKLLVNVINSSSNGIIAFLSMRDGSGAIIDFEFLVVNDQALEIIGSSREELIGSTLLTRLPGNKDTGLFDKYVNVVETGKSLSLIEHYDHDGLQSWFDITAVKNGNGFVVTFSDITPQKETEQKLVAQKEELQNLNYELEQFAYIASHDLQEPLRKIRAFGDRIQNMYAEKLDDRGRDYIERMQGASKRMQILIDDLLEFSRVSRTEREHGLIDCNNILGNILHTFEITIAKENAKIKADNLPTVKGDATQLTQLFQNLISNALKYAKKDVPPLININVKLLQLTSQDLVIPGEYWSIEISDNGIGFDPQYKDQIFQIFQRLHGRSEYAGTGIGLAICEKIVANHGGRIMADSMPGEGSIFTVYLPKINDTN